MIFKFFIRLNDCSDHEMQLLTNNLTVYRPVERTR